MIPELSGVNFPLLFSLALGVNTLAPILWTNLGKSFTDFEVVFVGLFGWTFCFYFLTSCLFAVLDLTKRPGALWAYRIQQGKEATLATYKKATKHFLWVSLVFHLPLHYAYYYHVKFGCQRNLLQEPFPSVPIVLRDFLVFLVIEEIGFYYGHRLMHHPALYKRFHKMHHEFTAPFGMTGTYAHPVEHILVNVIPMSAGAILMQSHFLVFAIWLTASIFTVITTHSGFQIPGLPPSIAHDYHHQALNANFGVLGILDTLHGTRGRFFQYLKEKEKQRQ